MHVRWWGRISTFQLFRVADHWSCSVVQVLLGYGSLHSELLIDQDDFSCVTYSRGSHPPAHFISSYAHTLFCYSYVQLQLLLLVLLLLIKARKPYFLFPPFSLFSSTFTTEVQLTEYLEKRKKQQPIQWTRLSVPERSTSRTAPSATIATTDVMVSADSSPPLPRPKLPELYLACYPAMATKGP